MSSVNAFLLWIKILKYLQFSKRVSFLFETLKEAWTDLVYYMLIFFVLTAAFAHAGYILNSSLPSSVCEGHFLIAHVTEFCCDCVANSYVAFSSDHEGFRSFSQSFLLLFRALWGVIGARADSFQIHLPFFMGMSGIDARCFLFVRAWIMTPFSPLLECLGRFSSSFTRSSCCWS